MKNETNAIISIEQNSRNNPKILAKTSITDAFSTKKCVRKFEQNMDSSFLKIILHSCKDAIKNIEATEDYETLDSAEIFVPNSEIVFNALSMSLTNLLCHKVSKEAHQRYSVRLNVIDVLRNWCSVPEKLRSLHLLRSSENMLNFIRNIMQTCLTDGVLDNCIDSDELIPLTSSLICLLSKNPDFINDIDRLVKRITQMESTKQGEQLLCHIVRKRHDIPVTPLTIELVYVTQAHKLIEEPLLNNFVNSLSPTEENIPHNCNINEVIELCTEFPSVFHLVCSLLKELFVKLNYAQPVSDYVKAILDNVKMVCERKGKHVIDLYPRSVHSCLILMRIEPCHHSVQSRKYTVDALRDISMENVTDAFILLSHFPAWLTEYATYVDSTPDNA